MFKLLIVDDEPKTREGLRDFITWSELKINSVRIASDGAEGLNVAFEFKPDIIITDIRMNRMNGIDFATKTRALLPKCKIIFISGYSDKKYLKAAIQLRAISYVEKPINMDEVRTAVSEAVALCLEELTYISEMEHSNLMEEKNINLIKDECTLAFIDANVQTSDVITKLLSSKINFPALGQYTTVILKLKSKFNNSNVDNISFHYRDIVDSEISSIFESYIMASLDKSSYVMHISHENTGKMSFLKNSFQFIMESISRRLEDSIDIFISVGVTVVELSELQKSYSSANTAMKELFFTGYNQIVFYFKDTRPNYSFNNNKLELFGHHLKENNKEEALKLIKTISFEVNRHPNTEIDYVKNIFFNLSLQVSKIFLERGIQSNDSSQDVTNFKWKLISEKETLNEIELLLVQDIYAFFTCVDELTASATTVFGITQFIQDNFSHSNLSITMIGESMNLTHSYLCQVFKKETDNTINQYITEYRLEKAKIFLCNKDVKLVELSMKCGYSDSSYFTRVFKKYIGITPSEYRKKYIL